jgi:hypothetical protein
VFFLISIIPADLRFRVKALDDMNDEIASVAAAGKNALIHKA